MAATPGSVAVGATLTGTIVPLEADGTTITPGAVVSSPSYSVSDTAIATVTTNPDGTATFTGVAPGTVTVSVTALVTDADGVAQNFSTTNTLAVTGASGRTASIQLNFS